MEFFESLTPGLAAEKSCQVTKENTALALGSGSLEVFATPAMAALMEAAALASLEPHLPPDWTSVGTELNIKHLSASPLGMKISARGELTGTDGRALTFRVEAHDEAGKIGEGTHVRFLVEKEKFLARAASKKGP
ncbi:MAG: thioesterase family protein [Treponema sp.]|nr:thioesterase family protein [Treponema sp.]